MATASPTVLLVEDDAPLRQSLAQWLTLNGFEVLQATNGNAALSMMADKALDVVLSDVRMGGMDGLELLSAIRKKWSDLPVVLLSGHGDVPMAVSAIQAGAFNFLTKPYVPEQLIGTLNNAVQQFRLKRRVELLEQHDDVGRFLHSTILGEDAAIAALRRLVADLSSYPLDVLILGETGTGKEVVARALHDCSERKAAAFVAINCAAVPADIFESELFGHDAGAFTGASAPRVGKFEFAHKGTIFLDEIESMPLAAQAKLLRVLQERQITRLGSNKVIALDVRVISATKFDLAELAREGKFREDLYYRLMGAEIAIPPLRARGNDAVLLFERFAAAMANRMGRPTPQLSSVDVTAILNYAWPGNVRQLKLLAERFALGLPWIVDGTAQPAGNAPSPARPLGEQLAEFERSVIEDALSRCRGAAREAAELLQIPHRTLNEKISRLGLRRP
ncbi:sigma-54 dependent transcriptional regulator [Ensifer sp. BR816]|uniref:sigma-54-dependent transcriptional regulator n=1 Tax=Rhizobium sp. (strain BR816) TaxID=1057002 RepID=UPI00036D4D69|nr:sigma-54 dependent transcriptional regulator [Ensifer sp. BR816]